MHNKVIMSDLNHTGIRIQPSNMIYNCTSDRNSVLGR